MPERLGRKPQHGVDSSQRYGLTFLLVLMASWPPALLAAPARDPRGSREKELSEEELTKTRAKLAAQLAEFEKRERAKGTYYTNPDLAMLKLSLEQSSLKRSSYGYWATESNTSSYYIRRAMAAARRLEENRKPGLPGKGTFEQAYLSCVDDSAQPYFVTVPGSHDPQKAYPLIVYLHGYSPDLSKTNWWDPGMMRNTELMAMADQQGYLVAYAFARSNTDFQGIGEVDVIDVLAEMKRQFKVDPNRVYLTGLSMGGLGAWTIAAHYPHLFAGIIPISGRADFYLWQFLAKTWGYGSRAGEPDYEALARFEKRFPAFQRWLLDGDFGKPLRDNYRNTGVYAIHGAADHLDKVQQSRQMRGLLNKMGYAMRYEEIADGSHWVGYRGAFADDRTFQWMNRTKQDPAPKQVAFRTYSLRYDRAHWIRIDELEEWGQPALVRAKVASRTLVEVQTENVAVLTLLLNQAPPLDPAAEIRWNGKPCEVARAAGAARLGTPSTAKLKKTHGLTGPVRDAYLSRFIMVYGTQGESSKKSQALARQAAREWLHFAKGRPLLKADQEVTEDDLRGANLILFGPPSRNSVLQKIAGQLPIKIREDAASGQETYEVDGRKYRGDNVGLAMIYPNPLSPSKYVVIYSGLLWGGGLPMNHKLDLIPDFIIFNNQYDGELFTRPYAGSGPNHPRCAGFFDKHWRLSEKLTWSED